MFKAALWAAHYVEQQELANGTVPDTAPADWQAGVLDAMYGTDLKADLEACFVKDQDLADNADAFIAAVEQKDLETIKATIKKFTPQVKEDIKPCETPQYQDVHDRYNDEEHLVQAIHADPDYQLKLARAAVPHMKDIKANIADFQTKWDSGDYYGSGVAVGNIEKMITTPW